MRSVSAFGLAALFVLASCESSATDLPCEPGAAPLAGTVGGADWTQASGAAAPEPGNPEDGVLDFYADPVALV
jgi:hypothetical protein